MATPRRRSSSTGFSSENIDESSNIVIEEIAKDSEEAEKVEQPESKPEVQPLPEIIPTEAPPPMSLKEAAKQEVVLETQPPAQQQIAVSRHPRNIPKFSKVRG
jgi:hypothetical protein